MYDEDYRWRDKRGRQITFEIGEDITAFVGGRQVGAIEFGDMDGSPYLRHMDVDEAYRRAGIATEMMRLAVEVHGPSFGRPSFLAIGGLGKDSSEYFTMDGAAFFKYCVDEEIVKDIPDFDERPFDEDDV
ncbi:GNAT family N-acetyltransferase [Stenotrophomonas geniculata]|jgi:GNAT superfamily N-acetyltransferase|uniref:GNAT family N-acetyltransferase n=1 Tax=Stenotrophomonas geniculata TaxID=86188 RepID=UPI002E76FFC0|nr:GNAT family N-acetyltransferase [Stenotrophomonas geniculata]